MKNKILFLLLCVFMLAAISPLSIFAAEGDTVTVYFMARGGNTADKTQPITSYECRRLTVPAGTTVSDVTYAIENNVDKVVSGSGLSYYETLFGQGSGLTGPSSGWLYYVDNYNTLITAANEYTVYDNMFILWEYISDFDDNWDAVIYNPVDFEEMRREADSKPAINLASDDTVSIYFMARGANTSDKTQPVTAFAPLKLTVDKGTTVSDVTYAIENNTDSVVSGSGLSYYDSLFGQGSGLTTMFSGWMYYVDNYDPVWDYSDAYEVYDGMFILWEYVSDFDKNWDAVIYEPVDFEAMRALADSRISCDMTSGVLRGDSNGDRKVTAADAAAVLQYTRFADSITIDLDVSDYDRSGILTANDAAWILNRTLNNAA